MSPDFFVTLQSRKVLEDASLQARSIPQPLFCAPSKVELDSGLPFMMEMPGSRVCLVIFLFW